MTLFPLPEGVTVTDWTCTWLIATLQFAILVTGSLQRKEADVGSSGMGLSIQRALYVDYPIRAQVKPTPITLIAAIPKGGDLGPNSIEINFGPKVGRKTGPRCKIEKDIRMYELLQSIH